MSNSQIRIRRDEGVREPFVHLVIDAPEAARLLRIAFSEFGKPVEVQVSTSCKRASQMLDDRAESGKSGPDAIVLDADNLAENGLDRARDVRELVSNDLAPVVIFSREDDPDVIQEYYECGAVAYLLKPDDYDGLADVVAEVETIVGTAARENGIPREGE